MRVLLYLRLTFVAPEQRASQHDQHQGRSLDEPLDLSNAVHIWVSRKLPGVVIPSGRFRLQRNQTVSPSETLFRSSQYLQCDAHASVLTALCARSTLAQ
jgi:hypothetical protein